MYFALLSSHEYISKYFLCVRDGSNGFAGVAGDACPTRRRAAFLFIADHAAKAGYGGIAATVLAAWKTSARFFACAVFVTKAAGCQGRGHAETRCEAAVGSGGDRRPFRSGQGTSRANSLSLRAIGRACAAG